MPYDKEEVSIKDHSPVKCILVVEDDAANGACFAEMIVQETPYYVLLAPTSLRALEIVRNIKPNLFIFDYRLPQMNGVQLFDQLHALPELEDVPALILTACLEDCEAEIETRKLIRDLPAGVNELYCHPGAYVGASENDPELAALLSPAVRAACERAGVELRHYA